MNKLRLDLPKEEVKRLWDEGFTVREIARSKGCSESAIMTRLLIYGIGWGEWHDRSDRRKSQIYQYRLKHPSISPKTRLSRSQKALKDFEDAFFNCIMVVGCTDKAFIEKNREKIDQWRNSLNDLYQGVREMNAVVPKGKANPPHPNQA